MANSFDFELRADDQVSAALEKINEQVKGLQPELDKTNDSLALGGQGTKDNLGDLNTLFGQLGRFAKDNVQFIGDMVPPLRNFTGMAGQFGGLVGKFGVAGGAAYLAGKGISAMGGQISEAAEDAYSLQVAAENAGMGVKDFTQLAGAMRLLGSDSASARGSVEGLYKTFNDALQGRNSSALAVMNQIHAGIVRNADGTANVLGTMQQLAAVFPKLSPQNQKTVADALGLDADGLQLLREGSRLKELLTKADEVGLTVDPKINGQLVTLNRNLTDVSASWDGLKNRMKQKLAGTLLSDGSVNDGVKGVSKVLQHPTSGLAWEQAGGFISDKQADWIARARKDKPFMDSLSTSEQLAVITGHLDSSSIQNKLQVRYGLSDQANQLQDDVRSLANPVTGAGIPASGVQDRYALSVANNNPWNLRYAGQPGAVPGAKNFARFGSGDDGVSAADRQLMLYYTGESKNVDHPLRTLSEIISKASPSSDGNNTPAMIQNASKELGIAPDTQLNLTDPRERARVLGALFNQEGNNPYTTDRIQQIIQDRQQPQSPLIAQAAPAVPQAIPPVVQVTPPATQATPTVPPSIVAPYRLSGAPVAGQQAAPSAQDIANAVSEALKQNGMKVEITMVDSKTGQRQTYTGNGNGAKVTTAMTFPR